MLLCVVKQLIHFIPENKHCDIRKVFLPLLDSQEFHTQLSVATGQHYKALLPFQLGQKMKIQRENKLTFKRLDCICGWKILNLPLGLIKICRVALIFLQERGQNNLWYQIARDFGFVRNQEIDLGRLLWFLYSAKNVILPPPFFFASATAVLGNGSLLFFTGKVHSRSSFLICSPLKIHRL